jgi:dipeptidyl aminopeptidase/acylaminoacyl peptidase
MKTDFCHFRFTVIVILACFTLPACSTLINTASTATPTAAEITAVPPTAVPPPAIRDWAVYDHVTEDGKNEYRIVGAEGHATGALALPDPPSPKRDWLLISSQASEFFAAFPQLNVFTANPTIDQQEEMSSSLLIIKIPDGKVIRDVGSLLPEGALINIGPEHQWSPDGRYFAFAAAAPGKKLAVFIYDVQQDQVRRLTDQAANLFPWDWSPDSQTILAREFTTGSTTMPADYLGVWTVGLDGHVKHLYKPATWDEFWKWKSANVFYVLDNDLGKYTNLRSVNIVTGEITELYRGQFTYVAMNPPLDEIILTFTSTGSYKVDGIEPGIFRLVGPNQLGMIVPGEYWAATYYTELGMFAGFSTDETTTGFAFDGTIRLKLGQSGDLPAPSPDGQFIIHSNELLKADGNLVTRTLNAGAGWLDDSSGFFVYIPNGMEPGKLYLYRKSTDWQPELLDSRAWGGPYVIQAGR